MGETIIPSKREGLADILHSHWSDLDLMVHVQKNQPDKHGVLLKNPNHDCVIESTPSRLQAVLGLRADKQRQRAIEGPSTQQVMESGIPNPPRR